MVLAISAIMAATPVGQFRAIHEPSHRNDSPALAECTPDDVDGFIVESFAQARTKRDAAIRAFRIQVADGVDAEAAVQVCATAHESISPLSVGIADWESLSLPVAISMAQVECSPDIDIEHGRRPCRGIVTST